MITCEIETNKNDPPRFFYNDWEEGGGQCHTYNVPSTQPHNCIGEKCPHYNEKCNF